MKTKTLLRRDNTISLKVSTMFKEILITIVIIALILTAFIWVIPLAIYSIILGPKWYHKEPFSWQ